MRILPLAVKQAKHIRDDEVLELDALLRCLAATVHGPHVANQAVALGNRQFWIRIRELCGEGVSRKCATLRARVCVCVCVYVCQEYMYIHVCLTMWHMCVCHIYVCVYLCVWYLKMCQEHIYMCVCIHRHNFLCGHNSRFLFPPPLVHRESASTISVC